MSPLRIALLSPTECHWVVSVSALARLGGLPLAVTEGLLLAMNVRVVFVDWYETLSTSLLWQRRPGSRLSAADSARVESYVFSCAELVRQWMLGAVAAEDVCILAAGRLGLAAADLVADLQHSCRCFEFDDPASVDSLQAIREQGIKVVLATDNMDAFCRWTVPAMHLGGIFDAILGSASLGVLKLRPIATTDRDAGRKDGNRCQFHSCPHNTRLVWLVSGWLVCQAAGHGALWRSRQSMTV
jgi:hypothetical protein